MEFYEKLQKLRKESSMSQEELAEQLNVSRQAVSRWESGQGFPETEKILQISSLYGVSLDYLLKSEGPVEEAEGSDSGYYASREAVEGYLATKRVGARRIALGVAVCILAFVPPMVFTDMLGGILFFVCAAIGAGILILSGFQPKRYRELETQPLVFDPSYLRDFKAQYTANRKRYGMLIVLGVVLIILGFVAMMVLNSLFGINDTLSGIPFPVFVAAGVSLLIIAGSADSAEGLIANNETHVKEIRENKQYGWIYGAFMGLASMAFLTIGFLTRSWHPAWLVFPVAAILATAIVNWRKSKR